ncbi:MAG TPA: hypothetical protein VG754_13960 [Verrucomicrobiae bacterium]|jgi:hypothetical protein|nr:hypothetical protein [Verrucomicrobiae bacterium]
MKDASTLSATAQGWYLPQGRRLTADLSSNRLVKFRFKPFDSPFDSSCFFQLVNRQVMDCAH